MLILYLFIRLFDGYRVVLDRGVEVVDFVAWSICVELEDISIISYIYSVLVDLDLLAQVVISLVFAVEV